MQFGVHLLGLGRRASVEDFILAPLGNPNLNEFLAQMKQFRNEVMEPARMI